MSSHINYSLQFICYKIISPLCCLLLQGHRSSGHDSGFEGMKRESQSSWTSVNQGSYVSRGGGGGGGGQ